MSDLSHRDPLTRFSARAQDYAKYRPAYPAQALAWILSGLNVPANLRIADIGAGTGISSRLIADTGAHVVAVEPNEAMLSAARRHTRVRYLRACAEDTGLPAHSFDVITAFQAFHWFGRDGAMREFLRLLRPRGRIAVAWNNRDRTDEFTVAYAAFIESLGPDVGAIERGKELSPVEETLAGGGFTGIVRKEFRHFHRMDRASFIGYARSASYLPREGEEYERLRAALDEIFDRYRDAEGYVTFPYRTTVFRADLPRADRSG